jgi:flavorubredoxin
VALTDEVEWIAEAIELPDGRLQHVSVYLIRTPNGNIVIDSGSFYHRDSIRDRLSAAVGDQGVQALVLSHSDYPHSGNIGEFRKLWGDFEIVASCGNAAIQGLPYATESRIGGTLDVLSRGFRFLDPPLADRSHTSWIYDTVSQVLFAADGFGIVHSAGETSLTSRDYPQGISQPAIHDFHEGALVWLRYADPDVLGQAFDMMFEANPCAWVAPIHGAPIARADLPDYVNKLKASVRSIADGYAPRS